MIGLALKEDKEDIFKTTLIRVVMAADFIELGERQYTTLEAIVPEADDTVVFSLPAQRGYPATNVVFPPQEVTVGEDGAFEAIDKDGVSHKLVAKCGYALDLYWFRGFDDTAPYQVVSGYTDVEPKEIVEDRSSEDEASEGDDGQN
jgi:hypothetical protein